MDSLFDEDLGNRSLLNLAQDVMAKLEDQEIESDNGSKVDNVEGSG